MFYRQLPAQSPIRASVLPRAALQSLVAGSDPRADLQQLLRTRYAARACALYASGTHALQVAIEAAIGDTDGIVLLPAYTCYEVATAAVGARARVALYDVDRDTLEPDWNSILAAVPKGEAAALVIAPLFGMPIDWARARIVADELAAVLIGDVAQSYGAIWNDLPAGASADMAVLSFGRGKGWTGAGGGALLHGANSPGAVAASSAPARGASEIKTLAKAGSQWLLGRSTIYGLPAAIPYLKLGETIYHEPTPPAPMSRASAALLLAGDEQAATEVLHRRRNAREYARMFDPGPHGVIANVGARLNEASGALRYPIRTRGGWAAISRTKAGKLGAACGYPTTLAALPALRPFVIAHALPCPQADTLVRELVTLPTHSSVLAEERRQLGEIVCGTNSTV
jgi:dTDP-4-amino-4,6-dideoxygalactose transaminase